MSESNPAPGWPKTDPHGRATLTYVDGYTRKRVTKRYATTADALAVAFNYFAAEEAQVYDGDAPLDMDAERAAFLAGISIA